MNRTPGSSFAFYMGGSSSGKIVNERSAMQMTAVYGCVRILSEAIAGLPLHLYRYKEDGGKEMAAIEYFNYCILYRDYNENDIINLPLVKDGERVSYTGWKNYLKELKK